MCWRLLCVLFVCTSAVVRRAWPSIRCSDCLLAYLFWMIFRFPGSASIKTTRANLEHSRTERETNMNMSRLGLVSRLKFLDSRVNTKLPMRRSRDNHKFDGLCYLCGLPATHPVSQPDRLPARLLCVRAYCFACFFLRMPFIRVRLCVLSTTCDVMASHLISVRMPKQLFLHGKFLLFAFVCECQIKKTRKTKHISPLNNAYSCTEYLCVVRCVQLPYTMNKYRFSVVGRLNCRINK